MHCSIGSSWLSEAVARRGYQVSFAVPSSPRSENTSLTESSLQLFDDGDVVDRLVGVTACLYSSGNAVAVVFGVAWSIAPVAPRRVSRSPQVRAASVSSAWMRVSVASLTSTTAGVSRPAAGP